MADETSSPASNPEDWRSRDEMENLYYAIMDMAWRMKGWGPLAPDAPEAPERFEEVKAVVAAVMEQWGLAPEVAELDRRNAEAEQGVAIESGYGALSHRPFVQVAINGQMRPESARLAALWLMDAAAGAEQDGVVLDWAAKTLDVDQDRAMGLMRDLRGFREASRAKDAEEEPAPQITELRRVGARLIA